MDIICRRPRPPGYRLGLHWVVAEAVHIDILYSGLPSNWRVAHSLITSSHPLILRSLHSTGLIVLCVAPHSPICRQARTQKLKMNNRQQPPNASPSLQPGGEVWQMMFNHYKEGAEQAADDLIQYHREAIGMVNEIDRLTNEYRHIQLLAVANHDLAIQSMNNCAVLRQLVLDLYAAIPPSLSYLFERRVNRMIDEEIVDLLTDEEL
nr:MAG: hypothetical protein [Arizlama virus]